MMNFQAQAEKLGLVIRSEEVTEISLVGPVKQVHTTAGVLEAQTIIIATGSYPQKLGVPGEDELYGQGVSYCATCDGAFFRNREIVVVGGGDAAIDEAIFLTRFASKVTIVHRREGFRAAQISVERAQANPKIAFHLNAVVQSIEGNNGVEKVVLKDVHTGELSELNAQGVFIYVGQIPNGSYLGDTLELTEQGYVKADAKMHTNVAGVFVAGDIRETPLRQVATAVGDGAVAAMEAEKYIAGQH